ncbi:MAG: MBL fold metallo-hydrolase [Flammeovirgaceae bacterium]|nr:MBL fold metallo-hydrolase [Flammeovirgaceae bacterium]
MAEVNIIDLNFLGIEKAIASYLVETSEGPILIETGPHSAIKNLEKTMATYGYKLNDIKHVFLTHIHLDHAGGAWVFADHGAQIYLHPFGQKHMADPSRLMESARRIYQDDMDRLWGEMRSIPANQLIAVEDKEEIVIGNITVKAWHTPGHAIHHIAWQIGDGLFTGDVAGVKIGDGMIQPPCPPPDINIEDWQNSIQLMKTLEVETLYLTHFGKISNIHEHLENLGEVLLEWANWMKPRFDNNEDPKAVTPVFQEYVRQQLLAKGTDEKGIKQYEAANPAWMSVAGLYRYWRKRSG